MSEWIEIGKIVAPQGLKGDLRVYPSSDFPERFIQPGKRWLLPPGKVEPHSIELLGGRYIASKGLYVIELAGIESREQAEALRNSQLLIEKGDRPQLEKDEFYVPDLIGLTVINQLNGEIIGKVVGIISAGNDLLEVEKICPETKVSEDNPTETTEIKRNNKHHKKTQPPKSQNILIPFVKEIVPVVNCEQNLIEITPPAGLIDL
ncbi:MAG: ribosome maturation factor RimM [Trichodesmium sp.]